MRSTFYINTASGHMSVDGHFPPELLDYLTEPTMSKYLTFTDVTFKDKKLLLKALAQLGYTDVEVHDGEGANLIGYHGDTRADKANVIVRRKYIGTASNDIGFRKTAKGYVPIVSEYDRGYARGGHFLPDVRTKYNELTAREVAKQLGGVVHKSEKSGKITLTVRY